MTHWIHSRTRSWIGQRLATRSAWWVTAALITFTAAGSGILWAGFLPREINLAISGLLFVSFILWPLRLGYLGAGISAVSLLSGAIFTTRAWIMRGDVYHLSIAVFQVSAVMTAPSSTDPGRSATYRPHNIPTPAVRWGVMLKTHARFSRLWFPLRRGARVVESGGLEIRCAALRYRGFESHPLRPPLQRRRSGTVRLTVAKPRQIRKEAAVGDWSGCRGALGLSWRGLLHHTEA
jgi:hypothetical protein